MPENPRSRHVGIETGWIIVGEVQRGDGPAVTQRISAESQVVED
jgi:hypothetical protein